MLCSLHNNCAANFCTVSNKCFISMPTLLRRSLSHHTQKFSMQCFSGRSNSSTVFSNTVTSPPSDIHESETDLYELCYVRLHGWHKSMHSAAERVAFASRLAGFKTRGPITLPSYKRMRAVNRSAFSHSTTKEHLGLEFFNRLVVVEGEKKRVDMFLRYLLKYTAPGTLGMKFIEKICYPLKQMYSYS